MTTATYTELANAKNALARYGYESAFHENGHLIVQDPWHRSVSGGKLELGGFKPVAIRSYDEARKFINVRN